MHGPSTLTSDITSSEKQSKTGKSHSNIYQLMKTQWIYSPNCSRRPNSATSLNCWDLGMLMRADRAKDLCDLRGSVEDIWVRLVLLLHIHLIFFSFLGLHTLYGSSLYLGDENHMTSHLHLHEAEILFSSVPWIYSFIHLLLHHCILRYLFLLLLYCLVLIYLVICMILWLKIDL